MHPTLPQLKILESHKRLTIVSAQHFWGKTTLAAFKLWFSASSTLQPKNYLYIAPSRNEAESAWQTCQEIFRRRGHLVTGPVPSMLTMRLLSSKIYFVDADSVTRRNILCGWRPDGIVLDEPWLRSCSLPETFYLRALAALRKPDAWGLLVGTPPQGPANRRMGLALRLAVKRAGINSSDVAIFTGL